MNDLLVLLGCWQLDAKRPGASRSCNRHLSRCGRLAIGGVAPIQSGPRSERSYLGLDSSELFVQTYRVGFASD